MNDTRPVRASEQLDWEKLAAYLREQLQVEGELQLEQFPDGHSDLTYARSSSRSTARRHGTEGWTAQDELEIAELQRYARRKARAVSARLRPLARSARL